MSPQKEASVDFQVLDLENITECLDITFFKSMLIVFLPVGTVC